MGVVWVCVAIQAEIVHRTPRDSGYLVNTPTHNLTGTRSYKDVVAIYSDSDHAGDRPHTMKSQTGDMITLNGAPVQWLSKKQIAQHST